MAVARALASDPEVLLLDEPIASLDVEVREEVRDELAEHLRDFGGPTIVVTHDMEDVAALAADVVVLQNGRSPSAARSTNWRRGRRRRTWRGSSAAESRGSLEVAATLSWANPSARGGHRRPNPNGCAIELLTPHSHSRERIAVALTAIAALVISVGAPAAAEPPVVLASEITAEYEVVLSRSEPGCTRRRDARNTTASPDLVQAERDGCTMRRVLEPVWSLASRTRWRSTDHGAR